MNPTPQPKSELEDVRPNTCLECARLRKELNYELSIIRNLDEKNDRLREEIEEARESMMGHTGARYELIKENKTLQAKFDKAEKALKYIEEGIDKIGSYPTPTNEFKGGFNDCYEKVCLILDEADKPLLSNENKDAQ